MANTGTMRTSGWLGDVDIKMKASRTLDDGLNASSNFDGSFEPFSVARKVTIITEGVPLRQALSAESQERLKSSLAKIAPDDVKSQCAEIAAAYDYDSEWRDAHTVLLTKRYSDPNDLPCVTYAEMVHSLKSVVGILDSYAAAPVSNGIVQEIFLQFYDSLTDQQRTRSKYGLSFTELTPAQQNIVVSAVSSELVEGGSHTIRAVLEHLLLLPNKRTTFGWMKMIGGDAFGYQGPFRANGSIRRFPLNNGFVCQVGGAYRHVVTHAGPVPDGGKFVPAKPPGFLEPESGVTEYAADPSSPTDLDRALASGMLSNKLPSTLTLGQIMQRLSDASPAGHRYSAESSIAEKPVSLFGQRYSTPNEIVRDVAAVYGLRVISPTPGEVKIATVVPRRIEAPNTAGMELVRMIPPSLFHFYSGQRQAMTDRLAAHENVSPQFGLGTLEGAKADVTARTSLYFPAVRRLLALALPLAPDAKSPAVPVSAAGPEAYRLISLLMLSGGGLVQIENLKDFEPKECLMHPETLCVIIKHLTPPNGLDIVDIRFGHRDDAGTFVEDGHKVSYRSAKDAPQSSY